MSQSLFRTLLPKHWDMELEYYSNFTCIAHGDQSIGVSRQKNVSERAEEKQETCVSAFNLRRKLQLPPATHHFTILIYTFPLRTEPRLKDTSVSQKQLSSGKPSWAAVLPLSKGSLNLGMPFFNLITQGAVTSYTL